MRISAKLNLLVSLVVGGLLMIAGLLLFVVFTINGLRELERDMIVVVRDVYRLGDQTKTLLVSDEPLAQLHTAWSNAVTELGNSIESLTGSRYAALLGEDVRGAIQRTGNVWTLSLASLQQIDDAVRTIIGLDTIPNHMKTGVATMMSVADRQAFDLGDAFYTLNRAQRTLHTIDMEVKAMLVETLSQTALRVESDAAAFRRQMTAVVSAIGIVILVTAFWIALRFTGRLARRIRDIEAAMSQVAERDMTVRMHDLGNDEIGSLGTHLNGVLSTLAGFFDEVKQATENINELKDAMANSSSESAASLNQITRNIESIKVQFTQLDRSIAQAGAASSTIGNEVSELANGITSQASAITQSNSGIEQINKTMEEVAGVAAEHREGAQSLLRVVQEGGEKIGSTNELVRSISAEVQDILQVIEVIDGISGQTNLLSMNAAIESAHAGEAGRGFAVVAEEIRKLADSTSENSRQISGSLKSITERIADALESSDASYRSYEDISQSVESFAKAMAQISERMQALSAASTEVHRSAREIGRITEDIRRGSTQIDSKTNELQHAMATLQSVSSHVVQGIEEIDNGAREILQSMVAVSTATIESRERMESLGYLVETFRTLTDEHRAQSTAGPATGDDETIDIQETGVTRVHGERVRSV